MPNQYRKKPVVIEALQFTGHNDAECLAFCPTARDPKENGPSLIIPTLEGDHRCSVGDYIIRGVKGEFYPCKPDIFEATYDQTPYSPADVVSPNMPREGLSFSNALNVLKRGYRIARTGWNGKGMWLVFMQGGTGLAKFNDGPDLDLESCIGIMTAQGKLQPGWHPSQLDMLAEDWYILGT